MLIPPVGQNFASGIGPENALRAAVPPFISAGKNLNAVNPASLAVINSPIVAIPGITGTGPSIAAFRIAGVNPGVQLQELLQ